MYIRNTLAILFSLFIVSGAAFGEEEKKRINLGIVVPLTGPFAFFGNDFVHTYELAVSDHPEIKETINVIWADSAYDSKQALSAFHKLSSVDNVDIVLSFGGAMLSALAPVAESKQIPFFATESEKRDCEGRQFCSLFRNEQDEWGRATWEVLRKQGKRKIGIVKNQNRFIDTFVEAIINTKAKDESVEIVVDVPPGTTDLRTNVLALQRKSFDAVGVFLLPDSHQGFLKALRGSNKQHTFFGIEQFLDKEINKGFEDITNGAVVVALSSVDGYREKFESRYGYSAGFFYTPGVYDFLLLLHDVISRDRSLRKADLVKAMRFSGHRDGVSGRYSVKVSDKGVHSYSFPIAVYRVENDKVRVVDTIHY